MTRRGPQLLVLALILVAALVAPPAWRLFRSSAAGEAAARRDPPAPAAREAAHTAALPEVASAAQRTALARSAAPLVPARRPGASGTEVHGVVALGGGPGASDVTVHVVLRHGARRRDLGAATTDAEGRYALRVELAAALAALRGELADEARRLAEARGDGALEPELARELDRRRAGLEARRAVWPVLSAEVAQAGYQPARAARRLAGEAPGRARLDLELARGAGVRGTVYHRGAPAPGARVHLLGEGFEAAADATADEHGRYVLPLPRPGPFRLHARALQRGAAGTRGFSLGAGLPHLEIDLDVDGLGALYGRVRLHDGTPLAGLRVEALASGPFAEELAGGPALAFEELARAEEAGGLAAARTRTDSEGRFAFEGLQRVPFAVRLPGFPRPGLPPFGPFEPSGEERELVVDAHVLEVQVGAGRIEGRRARFEQPWIELLCVPEREPGDDGAWRPPVRALAPAAAPSASFLVEPGRSYRVLARTATRTAGARVRVTPAPHRTTLELQLGEWDAALAREIELADEGDRPGHLEVVVADARGAPASGLALDLWPSGDPGAPLLQGLAFGPGRPLPALPPGTYDLRVHVLGAAAEWVLPPAVRRGVELEPGGAARVELTLERGGRIALRLPEVHVPRGLARAAAVTTRLRDLRTGAILDRPEYALDGGATRDAALFPGERGVSDPIAPGRYDLTFQSAWFQPPSQSVVVRAGERTEVAPLLVSEHLEPETAASAAEAPAPAVGGGSGE